MPELILPKERLSVEDVIWGSDNTAEDLKAQYCAGLNAYSLYCVDSHPYGKTIERVLSSIPLESRKQLACAYDTFGDNTSALASLYDKHLATLDLQNTAGLVGAGATVSENRLTGFQKALRDYQSSLIKLSEHSGTGRVAGAKLNQLKQAVRQAYNRLQSQFQAELKKFVDPAAIGKNRGNALTSAERGMLLAKRRKYSKIRVANTAKAQHLAGFGRAIHWTGNGMIALDAGVRVHGVHQTYKKGGNWQRQAAIEATGFGFAGVAGIATSQAAVGLLTTIGLATTPFGWVILIAAAGTTAYLAASSADKVGKHVAKNIYDRSY